MNDIKYCAICLSNELESNKSNTYDYPIHYSGQIINTNFKYEKHIFKNVFNFCGFSVRHV